MENPALLGPSARFPGPGQGLLPGCWNGACWPLPRSVPLDTRWFPCSSFCGWQKWVSAPAHPRRRGGLAASGSARVWRGTASLLGSEHDQGTSAARGHRLLLKVFKASHLESRRVPVTRSLEHTHPKPSGKVTADGFCSGTEIWVVRAGSCLFLPRLPSVALSAGRPQGPCVAGAAQGAWLLPWSLRALRGGVPALVPECQSSWPLG